MAINEFCELLAEFASSENIPFRHYEFTAPTSAPCMVWLENEGESIHADSLNVLNDVSVRLELYIRPEDNTTNFKLEQFLYDKGLSYERDRAWVSERHEKMIIYDICI